MYNYDNSLPQTDLYSTVCLWSNSRTRTLPCSTIAPRWSLSYPEYLSPSWDEETQQAVVWKRLQDHRKLARQGVRERYKALRQEQQTRIESHHEPSSRDILSIYISCNYNLNTREEVLTFPLTVPTSELSVVHPCIPESSTHAHGLCTFNLTLS